MSQWDEFDRHEGEAGEQDGSLSGMEPESSADIYDTPDVAIDSAGESSEEEQLPQTETAAENLPEQTAEADTPSDSGVYGSPYSGGQPYNDGNSYNNGQPYNSGNPYGNGQPYNSGNPYGNGQPYNNGNPYGNGQPYNSGNPYDNGQPYNGGNPYNNGQPYNNGSPYGNEQPYNNGQPYNSGNPYNNGQPYNNGTPYSNGQPYNNGTPYSNGQPYNNGAPYSNGQPYSNGIPYNNGQPYNNQYSPYAVPPKKNKNGLIIGIVIAFIVLFIIAAAALVYRLGQSIIRRNESRRYDDGEEYDFDYDDDGWGVHHDNEPSADDDYGYEAEPYKDGDDASGGSEYYDLHDELRWDLSYIVDFEEYYEGDDEENQDTGSDREIYITYPVIAGDDVPNLDSLNRTIQDEVDFLVGVADDAEEGVDVSLSGEAYVTYMDEEKLSIVFKEDLYLTDENGGQIVDYYLYSLNIDMEKGVVLDNRSMIDTDDDFSVDFRQRSDKQNGEISYLTSLSDQEITDYFESDDIIVFYTPLGMEIGFNYEYGWVTVTYRDYEQYLKVF